MLNEMRYGTLSEESIKTFRTLSRVPAYNGIEPTELCVVCSPPTEAHRLAELMT